MYGHASDAITPLKRDTPQVVLLDIGPRRSESLRVAARVHREFPDVKVVAMDLLPIHEDVVEFVNAGVSGFILKDATVDDLVSTIRLVERGANVLPPAMVKTLFSRITREAMIGSPTATHTVKTHVRNVMEKLTLHTRLQIAAFAFGERAP